MHYYSVSSTLSIFRKVCAAKRRYYWTEKEEPRFTSQDIKDVKCAGVWKVIIVTDSETHECTTKDLNFRECEEVIKFLEIKEKEQLLTK